MGQLTLRTDSRYLLSILAEANNHVSSPASSLTASAVTLGHSAAEGHKTQLNPSVGARVNAAHHSPFPGPTSPVPASSTAATVLAQQQQEQLRQQQQQQLQRQQHRQSLPTNRLGPELARLQHKLATAIANYSGANSEAKSSAVAPDYRRGSVDRVAGRQRTDSVASAASAVSGDDGLWGDDNALNADDADSDAAALHLHQYENIYGTDYENSGGYGGGYSGEDDDAGLFDGVWATHAHSNEHTQSRGHSRSGSTTHSRSASATTLLPPTPRFHAHAHTHAHALAQQQGSLTPGNVSTTNTRSGGAGIVVALERRSSSKNSNRDTGRNKSSRSGSRDIIRLDKKSGNHGNNMQGRGAPQCDYGSMLSLEELEQLRYDCTSAGEEYGKLVFMYKSLHVKIVWDFKLICAKYVFNFVPCRPPFPIETPVNRDNNDREQNASKHSSDVNIPGNISGGRSSGWRWPFSFMLSTSSASSAAHNSATANTPFFSSANADGADDDTDAGLGSGPGTSLLGNSARSFTGSVHSDGNVELDRGARRALRSELTRARRRRLLTVLVGIVIVVTTFAAAATTLVLGPTVGAPRLTLGRTVSPTEKPPLVQSVTEALTPHSEQLGAAQNAHDAMLVATHTDNKSNVAALMGDKAVSMVVAADAVTDTGTEHNAATAANAGAEASAGLSGLLSAVNSAIVGAGTLTVPLEYVQAVAERRHEREEHWAAEHGIVFDSNGGVMHESAAQTGTETEAEVESAANTDVDSENHAENAIADSNVMDAVEEAVDDSIEAEWVNAARSRLGSQTGMMRLQARAATVAAEANVKPALSTVAAM